jgi:SAM-dependent methyltransferase
MSLQALRRAAPNWLKRLVSTSLHEHSRPREPVCTDPLPSYESLQALMDRYQMSGLVAVDAAAFRANIEQRLQIRDHAMEGYERAEDQRDFSVQFRWGHDHDFGDFALEGQMKDRHVTLLATFMDWFGVLPRSLDGLKVLDIGCWTGGTSLLLCAMGAQVVAIEEVKKYVECLEYLKQAFAIERLEPRHLSLYECTAPDLQDAFDLVLFAGVLYHVTDPILALRITFNCLRDGGRCLLETAVIDSPEPVLAYVGPQMFAPGGSAGQMNRTGRNWFFPSTAALARMMADVGYRDVQIKLAASRRAFAVARRASHVPMVRAGIAQSTVR